MMIRSLARASLAVLVLCLLGPAVMASKTQETAALRAAQAWLAVVDSGKYDESWDAAAGYFKTAVAKTQWRQAMAGARRPLGKVLSRKLRGKTIATELPGAPDGHYVVIQFTTTFANKRAAVETVTPMLENDGGWRVAGYFIK
jgi:hypothetical protein